MNELVKQKLAEGWTLVPEGAPFKKGDLSFFTGEAFSLDGYAARGEICVGLYGYAVRPPAEKPADQPSELTFGQAMDAVIEGKNVEYTWNQAKGVWRDWCKIGCALTIESAQNGGYKFRLKPAPEQPKFREYRTIDEVPRNKEWRKKDGSTWGITMYARICENSVWIGSIPAKEFLRDCIFADGSPCGVKE